MQGIFTIHQGLVKIEGYSPKGTSHTLALAGPGDIIGHADLFLEETYPTSASALKDCEISFVSRSDILNLIKGDYIQRFALLSHISQGVRVAEEKWLNQINKEAPQRIAKTLLFLHSKFQPHYWTRKEIAQWAGTTPETVMRTLSQFEKDGIISKQDNRHIRIVCIEKLKEICLS